MDAIVLNIFEINYSQLIQYEILEKLVTLIIMTFFQWYTSSCAKGSFALHREEMKGKLGGFESSVNMDILSGHCVNFE